MAIWPVQPLTNAKDTSLSLQPGTMPQMFEVTGGWFQLLTFDKLVKTIVNFQVVETKTQFNFQGNVIPMPPQALKMMPEGQRLWKWYRIFAWPVVSLQPDDVLIDQSGVQYRVMRKEDYTNYGYVTYDCVQDYSGSGP